jgi:hypothetical protein
MEYIMIHDCVEGVMPEGDEEGKTGSCRRQALEKQWKL